MNKKIALACAPIALIGSLLTGCGSIVKKPEINGVRKVAIVSLYADQMIPWTGGRGRVDHFDDETKKRVGSLVYKSFATEFRRLKWDIVPTETVTANAYYRKEFGPQQVNPNSNVLAKAANVMGEMKNATYFTPPGLLPIEWPKKNQRNAGASFDFNSFKLEGKKDFKGQMGDLAKSLNVDMVVLVGMDYCYTGATAVLGNGTAKFVSHGFVKAINTDGVVIVDTPESDSRCKGEYEGESDKVVGMIGGSVVLAQLTAKDQMVAAINEAASRTAKQAVNAIDKAMKD